MTQQNNQYHLRQKVRVINHMTEYDHLYGFSDSMLKEFGDKIVTIDFVSNTTNLDGTPKMPTNYGKPCDNYLYGIKEDNHKYTWSNTMFTVV